ncbi:MAG: CpsB/CapC family capsule biosynthesis tyrosine phosphatase [Desulfobacterales bacterium]
MDIDDDGSQSLSQSLTMARCAVKDGIHSIVATPQSYLFSYRMSRSVPKQTGLPKQF